VAALLRSITPGLTNLPRTSDADDEMRAAVEANVRWSMSQIRDTPEGRERAAEGKLKLVGAVYEIATGRVRWLE
jgi:carbonic anhydrase